MLIAPLSMHTTYIRKDGQQNNEKYSITLLFNNYMEYRDIFYNNFC